MGLRLLRGVRGRGKERERRGREVRGGANPQIFWPRPPLGI